MSKISDRLRLARQQAGYRSARAAAESLGLHPATYTGHENGTRTPKNDSIIQYARRFKVSADWLLTGVGEGPEMGGVEINVPTTEIKTGVPAPSVEAGQDTSVRHKPDELTTADVEFPKRTEMPQDVPVWGSAAGSHEGAFVMNVGDAIDYVRRPPGLVGKRDVFGIYVQGESMEPRFEAGELLYLDPHRPPRIRDYVVVVCQVDGVEQEAYVGRLAFRQGSHVALEKFNPSTTLELKNVKQVLRVISSLAELFGV